MSFEDRLDKALKVLRAQTRSRGGKPRVKRPTQLTLPLGRPVRKPRQLQLPLRMKFDAASIIAGVERLKPGQVPPVGWQISGSETVGYRAVQWETGLTRGPFQTRAEALAAAWRLGGKRRGGRGSGARGGGGVVMSKSRLTAKQLMKLGFSYDASTSAWIADGDDGRYYEIVHDDGDATGVTPVYVVVLNDNGDFIEEHREPSSAAFARWARATIPYKVVLGRRGGKRRFDPAQLAKGTAEELEHATTIKKIARKQLPVKKAAAEIAKDHLKEDSHYYDRLEAVAVPKRAKGLKAPRLKLLHRSGRLRVYLVDSHKVRKLYGDWTMGGHHRVYPDFIPPREVWIAEEVFDPERKLCTLHELHEYKLMGGGQDYDTAHDASTALEQSFRKGKLKGLDAALRKALRAAAAS